MLLVGEATGEGLKRVFSAETNFYGRWFRGVGLTSQQDSGEEKEHTRARGFFGRNSYVWFGTATVRFLLVPRRGDTIRDEKRISVGFFAVVDRRPY
jgi:hypothetical protein